MNKGRLIIIANRLPVTVSEKKGLATASQSPGGLVSSLRSYLDKKKEGNGSPPLWIGASDLQQKKYRRTTGTARGLRDGWQLQPVFLPHSIKEKFYSGFCNNTLWPLFHYFPSYAKFSSSYFDNYIQANKEFCKVLLGSYRPGDTIWIHDYHLMLLPGLIRKNIPDADIGFFLHIPFPSFELFRQLPDRCRKELLEGLLGADLIGFHTHDYVQYFLKSVRQILGFTDSARTILLPDRTVTVDSFPIGIDYEKFNAAIGESQVFAERNKIKKKFHEAKIIISADRLDYTKGLINRLKGFEIFLESHPEYTGKVVYLLIVVPSRDTIPKYKENKIEIEGLISKINGKYGNIDWSPVVYQYKSLEFEKLTGLYLAADAALISPMRDGMNLVAKEFVATRQDKRGVLILSETAGAASELGEAVLVNPTDRAAIAECIYKSLSMETEEQMRRNEEMQRRLQSYNVTKWAEDFLSQLRLCKSRLESLRAKEITPHTQQNMIGEYRRSSSRLLLMDYDGTLIPLMRFPHQGRPSPELISLLFKLSNNPKNTLVIVSGRQKEVLSKWFESLSLNLIAEHGGFTKMPGQSWVKAAAANDAWKEKVLPLFRLFSDRCPGSIVEEKALSIAWHFRNAEPDLGFARSRELINALMGFALYEDFQVMEGNKVIEARAGGIDKGSAAMEWIGRDYDFILSAGDDRTDEDLFRAVKGKGYSIKIGMVSSEASFNLKQQSELISLLHSLAAAEENVPAG